jgi:hypothetical protein
MAQPVGVPDRAGGTSAVILRERITGLSGVGTMMTLVGLFLSEGR